ncbi:MAG: molybdate ABC transporter permease subunit [Planctomycetota bacterium]
MTPADATPPAPRWAESAEGEAVVLSLWVSAVGVLIALPFGLGFGWLLARRDFFGKALVEGILTLPLVLPPVATGYLLLLLLGPGGWLGGWLDSLGLPIAFHWRGAAIAAAVMGFPLLLRAIRLGIEAVDPDLEDTARTLGASRLDVFRTVTLPLAWPGLLAGMTLAFARALGEFGATITLAGNIEGGTQTLPLALHTFTQQPGGEPPAMRLLVISIVLAIAAIVVSEQLARRHRRRLND